MKDMLTPPADALNSTSGSIWLDEKGTVMAISSFTTHTLDIAIENIKLLKQLSGGVPRLVIMDITKVRSITREARKEYLNQESNTIIIAIALITESNVGKMVGNMLIGLNNHDIPMKLFTDVLQAKGWLSQFSIK